MLYFTRKFIGNILIKETNTILEQCKLYEVKDEDALVGRFYSGDNFSFIEFANQKFRIDPRIRFFRKSDFKLFNQYTHELIASYQIPNGSFFGKSDTQLHFINDQHYKWSENNEHRQLSKPVMRSTYRFDLIGTSHYVVYHGIMMPDINTGHLNEDQVFEGEIQSGDNDPELLPVFAGIYLMEEKFRRIEKTPG